MVIILSSLYYQYCNTLFIGYNKNAHKDLGATEVDVIYDQTLKDMNDKKGKPYINWADEELYNVGKYASQNGIRAAIKHYQSKCKNSNEITVREFKSHVEKELKISKKRKKKIILVGNSL